MLLRVASSGSTGGMLLSLSRPQQKQLVNLIRLFHQSTLRSRGYRSAGWWTHEHKAAPHPGNDPELRRQAALKYGLLPADYKTFEPEANKGEYPDLGDVTYEHKDPHEDWNYSNYRRNWGEPMRATWSLYTPDRQTYTGIEQKWDFRNVWWRAGLVYGTYLFIICILWTSVVKSQPMAMHPTVYFEPFRLFHLNTTLPKQYPYDFKRAWPYDDPLKYPIDNYGYQQLVDAENHGHH